MHPSRLAIASFALGALLWPRPVAAQDDWSQPWADPLDRPPRVDVTASVGFLVPSDWSNLVLLGSISSASGILEQVLVRDLRVEPDKEFSGAFTYWRGRYGFRARAGFSNSKLTIGGGPLTAPTNLTPTSEPLSLKVDTWLYEVGGAIGFIEYEPTRWAWPYGFFGLGGVTYDLERTVTPPLLTFIERPPPSTSRDGRTIIIAGQGRQFLLSVDELKVESEFAFSFGVGTDLRIPMGASGVGVRLEAADTMTHSPLGLRVSELTGTGGLTADSDVDFGIVHHLSMTVGVVLHIGR